MSNPLVTILVSDVMGLAGAFSPRAIRWRLALYAAMLGAMLGVLYVVSGVDAKDAKPPKIAAPVFVQPNPVQPCYCEPIPDTGAMPATKEADGITRI